MNDTAANSQTSLLRGPAHDGHQAVGFAELFFDLVYVFAITQLSHYLLGHSDPLGIMQGIILFLAVWWGWIYMTWATNWVDPDRGAVRAMIFLLMLAGLVMAAAIPKAFGDRAAMFASAYLAMQIGRTAWLAWIMRHERRTLSLSLTRGTIWFLISTPFWMAGVVAGGTAQIIWWAAALLIELVAPAILYPVPGMARSNTGDFGVTGGHMAERCGLFIIVCLGEGILLTGATFAEADWVPWTVGAFLAALSGSIAMWWIYFDVGAKRASEHIAHHEDSGRVARDAYTYLHIPIVAGIVMTAAADEMVLAHPYGHVEPLLLALSSGGTAMFLIGLAFFKRATSGRPWLPLSHLVGAGLLVPIALWGLLGHPQPLHLVFANVAVLVVVAAWEWVSLHGGWAERGMSVPATLQARADRMLAEQEASATRQDER